ncbi:hypothetical protein L6452_28736 [Arctium lappa]|uniref:Uncharacterized protein n=2 Tax=Arctium lappa TaxID=4217 RepID=A0ACB8ZZA0_ARCLA|nr:hypothetical protein L6452_28734 [Arctium lappa]KAI3702982.1 hypothetical protein L6452_28736 [Arctium lappa]
MKHRQSVPTVVLSEDDSKEFSASKDGYIVQWDMNSEKAEAYVWPSEDVLKSHGAKDPQVEALIDIFIYGIHVLTNIFSGMFLQAFPGHKGPVSCLTFRQGTWELFSGSYDRTIKIWNAEDRTYITTLFGHQSDVLTIDCLRKERATLGLALVLRAKLLFTVSVLHLLYAGPETAVLMSSNGNDWSIEDPSLVQETNLEIPRVRSEEDGVGMWCGRSDIGVGGFDDGGVDFQ